MLDHIQRIRAQTRADFHQLWSGWKLVRKRKPSEWATQERRIASGQSPLTDGEDISYDHKWMPWCVEPMDMADDPDTNIIVLWFARRMGKTEGVCGNIFGRTVTDDPGNCFSMWPVEDSSDRFSRDVIEPMIGATASMNRVFVERKSRETGRTVDYKRFHGGSLYITNAGSKSKSRGMAAKVIFVHEVDAYPVSSGGEGDPVSKAFGRADGFEAIKVIESTGTKAATMKDGIKKYNSNIEMWHDRGDQRKWMCPCRKCGREQWLKFEQIKPHKNDYAYFCEWCETSHNEAQWRRMVLAGTWKPTAPFAGIRSYWINQFCSLFPKAKGFKSKLEQFVIEGLRAINGKPEEKQVWITEVKAELWSSDGEEEMPPDVKILVNRREPYAVNGSPLVVPAGVLFITGMVDVQIDRLEVMRTGYGRNEESWALEHVVIDGNIRDDRVWKELSTELQRTFQHELGCKIGMTMTLVDGGWAAEWVYRFTQSLARHPVPGVTGYCRASKGIGKHGHPIVDRIWRTVAKNLKGYHIGTWEAKSLIYQRLMMKPNDDGTLKDGYIHLPESFSEELIQQIVSEKKTVKHEAGETLESFENEEGVRNEGLDLMVGCLAAFRLRHRNYDRAEAELKRLAEESKSPEIIGTNNQKASNPKRNVSKGIGWSM